MSYTNFPAASLEGVIASPQDVPFVVMPPGQKEYLELPSGVPVRLETMQPVPGVISPYEISMMQALAGRLPTPAHVQQWTTVYRWAADTLHGRFDPFRLVSKTVSSLLRLRVAKPLD